MVPFGIETPYNGENRTLSDELWNSLDVNVGMVALERGTTLQPAQRFPWDDSKMVYMLNGYHSLHCLVGYLLRRISKTRKLTYLSRNTSISF